MSRLLLVTPAFHGYWQPIARACATLGYQPVVHAYDAFEGVRAKLRNKVRYEGADRLGLNGSERMRRDLTKESAKIVRASRPEVVLVIKGDVLSEEFWDTVEASGARCCLWLYDELSRMEYADETLVRVGAAGSYSRDDTRALAGLGLRSDYVPLAYEDRDPLPPAQWGSSPEVTFAGARYPNREELLRGLVERGVPVRAYGRDWSAHPVDRARTWRVGAPDVPGAREVDLQEAHRVMARSTATLNIHGSSVNDGFTMRTFEACGAGALQLIDRDDVDAFYEPSTEVLVFHDVEEVVECYERSRRDPGWARAIREAGRRRTLAEHTFTHRVRQLEALWT